jgi:hypothetical protein
MPGKAIYATLIVLLTMEAAPAQTPQPITGGYSPMRDQKERKNDREIDSAYQSTKKLIPDTKKEKLDPWGDVRPEAPAAAAKKK